MDAVFGRVPTGCDLDGEQLSVSVSLKNANADPHDCASYCRYRKPQHQSPKRLHEVSHD